MKYHLDIYFKKKIVNSIDETEPLKVLTAFKEAILSKELNGAKLHRTKYPYEDKYKIIVTWPNSMPEHRYVYVFEGLCGGM